MQKPHELKLLPSKAGEKGMDTFYTLPTDWVGWKQERNDRDLGVQGGQMGVGGTTKLDNKIWYHQT